MENVKQEIADTLERLGIVKDVKELPRPKIKVTQVASEGHRKPAAGYAPGDDMWETPAFAKRRGKSRQRNKIAKAARRKNRK